MALLLEQREKEIKITDEVAVARPDASRPLNPLVAKQPTQGTQA